MQPSGRQIHSDKSSNLNSLAPQKTRGADSLEAEPAGGRLQQKAQWALWPQPLQGGQKSLCESCTRTEECHRNFHTQIFRFFFFNAEKM